MGSHGLTLPFSDGFRFIRPPHAFQELQERVEADAAGNDASAEENSLLRRERDCAEPRLQEPQGESRCVFQEENNGAFC